MRLDWRTCTRCGVRYPPGGYSLHAAASPSHPRLSRRQRGALTPPQRERNAAIVAAVRTGRTGRDIALEFGITRERVRQIWNRTTGLEAWPERQHQRRTATCPLCGEEYVRVSYVDRDGQPAGGWHRHRLAAGHVMANDAAHVVQSTEIVASYLDGDSTIQISHAMGLSVSNVQRILEVTGTPRRPAGTNGRSRGIYSFVSDDDIAEMRRLHAEGVAYTRIGVFLGRSPGTVALHLGLPYGISQQRASRARRLARQRTC